MNKLIKRLKCHHEKQYFIGAVDVYVDLWGYDHTKFTFECIDCGKKKHIMTRNPDVIWETLNEYWREI